MSADNPRWKKRVDQPQIVDFREGSILSVSVNRSVGGVPVTKAERHELVHSESVFFC